MRSTMVRAVALGGVVALTVGLAACSTGTAPPREEGETTVVEVGALTVTDVAVLQLGIDQGFFAEHDIELNFSFAQGGAAIVPAVVSGQYQVGYSNVISVFQAVERGLPLVMLNATSATNPGPDEGTNDLMVRDDGSVTSVADLTGKRVAVNTLGNLAEVLARYAIDAGGGDSSQVEFVELPFPDQAPALESGNVDAFLTGEPFGTIARESGLVSLVNTQHTLTPDAIFIIGAWFANADAAAADPELYAGLQDAINRSNAYAAEHLDEVRALIPEVVGLDAGLAERMRQLNWDIELTEAGLVPLGDASLSYGLLQDEPDYSALIWKKP